MRKVVDKYGEFRCFMASFGVLLVLFLIIAIGVIIYHSASINSITLTGNRLRFLSSESHRLIMVDRSGNQAIMTGAGRRLSFFEDSFAFDVIIVEYLNKTITRDSSDRERIFYVFSDGSVLMWPDESSYMNEMQQAERDLLWQMRGVYDARSNMPTDLFVLTILFGFVFIPLGLWNIIYSRKAWEIRHMFTVRYGEPTDDAIFMIKLGGAIGVIFPFVMLFFLVWMLL